MLVMAFAARATAQENSCFPYCYQCKASVIETKTEQILTTVDFKPKTAEEEMTRKILDVPGTDLKVHATVFFTDESLASNAGNDSIELALAVSTASDPDKITGANGAAAEVTLHQFDATRVVTPVYAVGKKFAAVLECRALPKPRTPEKR